MRYPSENGVKDCRLHEGDLHYCPPMSWKESCWDDFHVMSSIVYTNEFIRMTYIDYHIRSDYFTRHGAAYYYHSAGPLSEEGQCVLRALNLLASKPESQREKVAGHLIRALLEMTMASFVDDCVYPVSKREKTRIKIMNYIQTNFRQPLTRASVAEKFSLNPQYVSQLFAADQGEGFHATIRRMRLEYAVLLLRTSRLTVDEISHECGYSSATFFSTVFKRTYGTAPGEFRKKAE